MRNRRNRLWTALSAAILVSGAVWAPPVLAQAAEDDQADSGSDSKKLDEAATLDAVVVTARKRTESVRDVPTSIDAFTGARLYELGYTNVEELLKLSPGVTYES